MRDKSFFMSHRWDILTRMMNVDNDYESMIPCRSSYARLLPTGRKNYVPAQKQEKKAA